MSEVTIKVLGDTKNFDSAIDKSTSKTDKMGEKMGKAGGKLTKGLTLLLLPGAGAALFALATKAGENADRLLDMSAQTGISTDKLQEYEFVAGQAEGPPTSSRRRPKRSSKTSTWSPPECDPTPTLTPN